MSEGSSKNCAKYIPHNALGQGELGYARQSVKAPLERSYFQVLSATQTYRRGGLQESKDSRQEPWMAGSPDRDGLGLPLVWTEPTGPRSQQLLHYP